MKFSRCSVCRFLWSYLKMVFTPINEKINEICRCRFILTGSDRRLLRNSAHKLSISASHDFLVAEMISVVSYSARAAGL